MSHKAWLGVDVGSISMNLALLDKNEEVMRQTYFRIGGDPIRALQESLVKLRDFLPDNVEIAGVGVTGSGRHLIGAVIGADVVKNEISAHAAATINLHPDVQTIFEIGGQDSKMAVVRDRVVEDFAMNLVCAAGTGSFLDSQAKRLDISIEELSEKAMLSKNPTAIAGRCTVFAESDMIHKQQVGHRQEDIIMGLCQAMARNFLSNVCRGKEIKPPVVLQGGVSANKGIRRAFEEALGYELIIPRYNMVMGAYGASLIASRNGAAATRFRGFDICRRTIETRSFICPDCPNRCEIVEIVESETVIGRTGGRCRKWEESASRA